MSDIGRNLRVIRESLGISQEKLAEKAGYKNSAIIVAIESGNTEPAYEKVKDLANALGVSIYQLKGSNKYRKVPGEGIYYSEADITALDMFAPMLKEMPEEDVDKALDYMLLLLKAEGKVPAWKKPKFLEEK